MASVYTNAELFSCVSCDVQVWCFVVTCKIFPMIACYYHQIHCNTLKPPTWDMGQEVSAPSSPQPVREYGMLIFNKMLNICCGDDEALSIHHGNVKYAF